MLVVVLEDDHIAVTILFADKIHRGIGGRPNRGAGGGCVVDALMGAPCLQDGVEASAETGADSGELKWRAKKGFLQWFAVRCQIAASVVALVMPECPVDLSGIDEFRSDDPSATRRLSFLVTSLVGNGKTVAFAQIGVEVDFAAEYLCQLNGDCVRDAGCVGGAKQ